MIVQVPKPFSAEHNYWQGEKLKEKQTSAKERSFWQSYWAVQWLRSDWKGRLLHIWLCYGRHSPWSWHRSARGGLARLLEGWLEGNASSSQFDDAKHPASSVDSFIGIITDIDQDSGVVDDDVTFKLSCVRFGYMRLLLLVSCLQYPLFLPSKTSILQAISNEKYVF